jgi:hypothetical protein
LHLQAFFGAFGDTTPEKISVLGEAVVYGWIGYPRAKAKSQRTAVPAHPTRV